MSSDTEQGQEKKTQDQPVNAKPEQKAAPRPLWHKPDPDEDDEDELFNDMPV